MNEKKKELTILSPVNPICDCMLLSEFELLAPLAAALFAAENQNHNIKNLYDDAPNYRHQVAGQFCVCNSNGGCIGKFGT